MLLFSPEGVFGVENGARHMEVTTRECFADVTRGDENGYGP